MVVEFLWGERESVKTQARKTDDQVSSEGNGQGDDLRRTELSMRIGVMRRPLQKD